MRTGRRAWRKWLSSQRKHDKDSWSALLGAVRGRAAYARKHRGTNAGQGLPEEPGTDTVRSFTARSLVGMTMGARKRRWARDYDALPQSNRASKTVSMLRAYGVYPKEGNTLAQRLRPCPGCFHCQPGVKGWHIDRSRSGRFNMPALALHCDGSGVLLARKQG